MEVLTNPGVRSVQLLNPGNSGTARLTLTRVTVEPGAEQPRHAHSSCEQVWMALSGKGVLLLADGASHPFTAGEVARFAENEVHGFLNDSEAPFEYVSVTAPPADFREAYRNHEPAEGR
jgi:quercetin dioxygenase-like cupin family protein